jgi:hypothetical protein
MSTMILNGVRPVDVIFIKNFMKMKLEDIITVLIMRNKIEKKFKKYYTDCRKKRKEKLGRGGEYLKLMATQVKTWREKILKKTVK